MSLQGLVFVLLKSSQGYPGDPVHPDRPQSLRYPGDDRHIRQIHDKTATKAAIVDGLAWLKA